MPPLGLLLVRSSEAGLGPYTSVVIAALALLIAVVTYRCTKIDPSDPGVLAKRAGPNALPASAAARRRGAGAGERLRQVGRFLAIFERG